MKAFVFFLILLSNMVFAQDIKLLEPYLYSELPAAEPELTAVAKTHLKAFFQTHEVFYDGGLTIILHTEEADLHTIRQRFADTGEVRLTFQVTEPAGAPILLTVTIGADLIIRHQGLPILDAPIPDLHITNGVEIYHFPTNDIFEINDAATTYHTEADQDDYQMALDDVHPDDVGLPPINAIPWANPLPLPNIVVVPPPVALPLLILAFLTFASKSWSGG